MAIVERKRILRPSTRKDDSPYKVDISTVSSRDTVRITITHESDPDTPLYVFEVDGNEIAGKKSIHFSANSNGADWDIKFYNVNVKRIH